MTLEDFIVRALATPEAGAALAITYFGLRWLNRTPLGESAVFRRLLPVLPEPVALGVVFLIPGAGAGTLAGKVALGLVVAYAAQKAHKVIGQTALGRDPVIVARAAERARPLEPPRDPPPPDFGAPA